MPAGHTLRPMVMMMMVGADPFPKSTTPVPRSGSVRALILPRLLTVPAASGKAPGYLSTPAPEAHMADDLFGRKSEGMVRLPFYRFFDSLFRWRSSELNEYPFQLESGGFR
ncbi:hypothetical protein TNCV_1249131 [Trichonephila clavipes]|nr:hypothetical protein TNCV_1249131 [Trichonephila clavipes]